MGVIGTVRDLLESSAASTDRTARTEASEGAYWCHDCGERILDLDVEGDAPPKCPECGNAMAFERSVGAAGCAC